MIACNQKYVQFWQQIVVKYLIFKAQTIKGLCFGYDEKKTLGGATTAKVHKQE